MKEHMAARGLSQTITSKHWFLPELDEATINVIT